MSPETPETPETPEKGYDMRRIAKLLREPYPRTKGGLAEMWRDDGDRQLLRWMAACVRDPTLPSPYSREGNSQRDLVGEILVRFAQRNRVPVVGRDGKAIRGKGR